MEKVNNFEKSIQEIYEKPLTTLIKKNAPLTTKVLTVLHNENLSVSEALRILEEVEYVLKRITKV